MNAKLGVGVIGCGVISSAYFKLSKLFRGIEMVACADIDENAAKKQAGEFGLRAMSVDSLLNDKTIDIVVNLTVPAAHFEVSKRVLESGKHVFSEKPFVLKLSEGEELAKIAGSKGLLVASAPDTFLGGAHQLVRSILEKREIGEITSGSCHVMSHGMEHWHPNPDFFFKPGGGPILDIGPYYVTDLVNLIGPVRRVMAMSSIPSKERTIGCGPRNGENIKVETPTTILGVLEFCNGALVSLSASWDVRTHGHGNMELYGTKGTLFSPDPNFFGGDVRYTDMEGKDVEQGEWNHPLAIPNEEHAFGKMANYRTVGLAEMADSINSNRKPRCSIDLALHVIDVLTGLLQSAEAGSSVEMQTTCEQPLPLTPDDARSLMES